MTTSGYSDFRSDTVTRPTPAMLRAMTSAPLGDDVLGDDPTVTQLEELAASLFGKEAALFVPSGTMANQIAIRVHCRPGDEMIAEESSHVVSWEQGGAAQLSGVSTRALRGRRGVFTADEVERAVRMDDPHCTITRLVVLENTHNGGGGAVLPLAAIRDVRRACDARGLALHLDGARIVNAEAATGVPLAEWAAPFDTLTCCLSKGLCAPVGSIFAGTREHVRAARRVRKVFGGAMRQAGVLAAAGIVALRDMRERLVEDHARARRLAEGLLGTDGLEVTPPETNMVYVHAKGRADALAETLRSRGVLALTNDRDTLPLVTHHDVDDRDVDRAIDALRHARPA